MRLLLLPGMDGSGMLFKHFVAVLPEDVAFEVVSYPADQELDYQDLADLVQNFLSDNIPTFIVAESFSGPIGIKLAANQAPGVKGLVLVSSFAQAPRSGWWRYLAGPFLFRLAPPDFLLRRYLAGPDAPDSLVTEVREAIRLVKPGVLSNRVRSVLEVDVRDELKNIGIPIMCLAGNSDRLLKDNQSLRHSRSDITWHGLEAPHLVLQRAPAESYEHMRQFMGI